MTRIDFYRYAEDKLHFACRLAAKAYDKPARLVVYSADRGTLMRFVQSGFVSEWARDGHGGGWTEAFERLEQHLETQQ